MLPFRENIAGVIDSFFSGKGQRHVSPFKGIPDGQPSPKEMNALEELYYYTNQYRTGDSLNELFQFICRLPSIAPFNAMLLHIQKPGATAVATAAQWNRQFKRTIRPGARPLVILWPFAPVEFVYEAADTIGDTDLPETILTPFQASGKLPPLALKRLINNLIV